MKSAIILSVAIIFSFIVSSMLLRNAILKSFSRRFDFVNAGPCMLLDTRTGRCWSEQNGEVVEFNLRKDETSDEDDED